MTETIENMATSRRYAYRITMRMDPEPSLLGFRGTTHCDCAVCAVFQPSLGILSDDVSNWSASYFRADNASIDALDVSGGTRSDPSVPGHQAVPPDLNGLSLENACSSLENTYVYLVVSGNVCHQWTFLTHLLKFTSLCV